MIEGLDDEERRDLLLSVGTHRKERRLTPLRVAELIEKARARMPIEQLAEELQLKGRTVLKRFLSLKTLDAPIQRMVTWGQRRGAISFSAAVEIARLETVDERAAAARLALEHNLSKGEIQAIVQRMRRGGVTLGEASGEILRMRPVVERQYLFVGPLPTSAKDEFAVRNGLRLALAGRVGGADVLSVSVKDGRYAVLLAEPAAKALGGAEGAGEIERMLAESIGS